MDEWIDGWTARAHTHTHTQVKRSHIALWMNAETVDTVGLLADFRKKHIHASSRVQIMLAHLDTVCMYVEGGRLWVRMWMVDKCDEVLLRSLCEREWGVFLFVFGLNPDISWSFQLQPWAYWHMEHLFRFFLSHNSLHILTADRSRCKYFLRRSNEEFTENSVVCDLWWMDG